MEEIIKEFECPVCTHYMVEEIIVCSQGHSLCKKCKDNVILCPICKSPFGASRNFSFENVANMLTYKCRNGKCLQEFDSKNINRHETNCKFGIYACIFKLDGCNWIGRLSEYKKHMKINHKEYIDEFKMPEQSTVGICVIFYFEEAFVVFSKIEEKMKYYSAMYMGMEKSPKDFLLTIKFVDQTSKGYKLSASSPCIAPCVLEDVFNSDKVTFSVDENSMLEKCFKVDYNYKITPAIEDNVRH